MEKKEKGKREEIGDKGILKRRINKKREKI